MTRARPPLSAFLCGIFQCAAASSGKLIFRFHFSTHPCMHPTACIYEFKSVKTAIFTAREREKEKAKNLFTYLFNRALMLSSCTCVYSLIRFCIILTGLFCRLFSPIAFAAWGFVFQHTVASVQLSFTLIYSKTNNSSCALHWATTSGCTRKMHKTLTTFESVFIYFL